MTLSLAQYTVIRWSLTALIAVVRSQVLCFNDLAQRSDRELNYPSRTGWVRKSGWLTGGKLVGP
jgi:hypothetical protein